MRHLVPPSVARILRHRGQPGDVSASGQSCVTCRRPRPLMQAGAGLLPRVSCGAEAGEARAKGAGQNCRFLWRGLTLT